MRWGIGVTAALVASVGASAAIANETPVYRAAPEWVKPAPAIDLAKLDAESPVLLILDQQHRFEDGRVTIYADQALRMASAQVVNQAGTIQLPWQPHHGELVIHRAEILRAGETIDLLAKGERFAVLQREEQLEQLQMTGMLTATMTVQGLRVGDVLRITSSVTNKDEALKGQAQTVAPLIGHPARTDFARVRVLWPEGVPLKWRALAEGVTPRQSRTAGFEEIEFVGTLDKSPDLPTDAPMRYRPLPIVEATTFADWNAVSRTMAPHYATAGLIAAGSPLAAEVAKITGKSSDPRTRAALALQFVQDEIRYLFNGMAGGNYIPQSPTQTWSLRYGDCKAKTLLLLAMLREMDIEAEAVLAHTEMGDFVTKRLPSAAAFDHVIVRADIGGESLWLDGTRSGDRLADIGDALPFRHVLPLRTDGADLMPVELRAPHRADIDTVLELDQRAGVDFPAPFTIRMTFRGQPAQQLQQLGSQGSREQLAEATSALIRPYVGTGTVFGEKVHYDGEAATATLTASGVTYPGWTRKGAEKRIAIEYLLGNLKFAPDRTRGSWRNIPVATGEPSRMVVTTRTRMPDDVRIEGTPDWSATIVGLQMGRAVSLDSGVLTIREHQAATGAEVATAELAATRQAVARAKSDLVYAVSSEQTPTWQQVERGRGDGRFAPILAAYAADIAQSPDDSALLSNRAWFRARIRDTKGAIDDLTAAIAIDDKPQYRVTRGSHYRALDDDKKALADFDAAYELDTSGADAIHALAMLRAETGDRDGALALVEPRASADDEEGRNFLALKATLLARTGAVDDAVEALDAAVAASPRDATMLNNRCWLKGTQNVALDAALDDCTRAITLAENPAAALDSRAMVYFRLGRMDDALADLNAALDIVPDMPAAVYLRGIVLSHRGDASGAKRDLDVARILSPRIAEDYDRWGVKPKG